MSNDKSGAIQKLTEKYLNYHYKFWFLLMSFFNYLCTHLHSEIVFVYILYAIRFKECVVLKWSLVKGTLWRHCSCCCFCSSLWNALSLEYTFIDNTSQGDSHVLITSTNHTYQILVSLRREHFIINELSSCHIVTHFLAIQTQYEWV